jgi:hypothetical protein
MLIQSDEIDEYKSSSLRGGGKIPLGPKPKGQEAAQMMYLEQRKPDKPGKPDNDRPLSKKARVAFGSTDPKEIH